MNIGGFDRSSGPNTQPRAQTPFSNFPASPSPPRPLSPRSNETPLRWGNGQASSLKDHGAQTYRGPPLLLPQVGLRHTKTPSFIRTPEDQYIRRINLPYSQYPNEISVSKNSRRVIESDKNFLVPSQGRSPPPVFQNNLYVGGQHTQSKEVQQLPFPTPLSGNQLKTSRSVVITRGTNQSKDSKPMFQTKYADSPLPKRTRSPVLPSTSEVSPENTVFNSDVHTRSLIDYRDLDAPEAMSSPPLGFQIRSSDREYSRSFAGNQKPSRPNERASQSNHSISNTYPVVQEYMSPVSMKGAYESGRTLQSRHADVPLLRGTRSSSIQSTSGVLPQNSAVASDGLKRASDFRSQNQSEVAGDRQMHFPALKRTKLPLPSSPDQLFEDNLDPSEEVVRESLAKERRLARFRDELSEPLQSHSTISHQKVPSNRPNPSTSGRQKYSEDPTTAGIGDFAGGIFSSEYEALLSNSIVGLCPDMCPESERAERERKGDLDQYERLNGDRNLTSEFIAVKKYTRTAEREADLIRPMPVLQKTMDYLLSLLDEPYDDRFLRLYNFLWDRMRAVRMDLRMQHLFNLEAVSMLEQMIRLHIIVMHELCEYTKGEGFSEGFDAHLNIEQMNKTSVELFQLYDDHRRKGIHVPSEREFRGYYALLKLDKHPGYKVEPAELSLDLAKMTPEIRQTPEVLFARDVARACRTGNFVAFFKLARKASYLQACLMHAHFSKLRTHALASLHCGLQMNQGIPITVVAKWLAMEEEDIENLLEYYGFSLKDFKEPYMVKENAFINVENDFPVKRSKLVNHKRSTMIVRDVSFLSHNESYGDVEAKRFQPKKVPEQIPTPVQCAVLESTILSPKGGMQNRKDKASIALTTPVKDIIGHEVQSSPASPLVLGFSKSSFEHGQNKVDFFHTPKFEPVLRNSFGKPKPNLEKTVPITHETAEENRYPVASLDSFAHTPIPQPMFTEDLEDEEQTFLMEEDGSDEVTTSYYDKEVEEAKLKLILRIWKRRAARMRESRERKQLTANAALNLMSMGPPIWQFEVPSSLGTFDIDHVMSERRDIRERSWSVLNPSEVLAPKLVEKNPNNKCLCWKLLLISQNEENIKPPNRIASLSDASSWLHSKLMPANNDADQNLLLSSPCLSIWGTWVPSRSNVDRTCCLSVIKSITIDDQYNEITGTSAVVFVLSEHIPIQLQKKRLHDFFALIPSGSRVPLLVLSGGSIKDEFDFSDIAETLGLDGIDKSKVMSFRTTSLKNGCTDESDGFLSDEKLREGLNWLASESPRQIHVRGIKTRELVLSNLHSNLEILDDELNNNTHEIGPNNCILAFNGALDRSIEEVFNAARENPTGWPCPEINMLDESSDEYMTIASYLPRVDWSRSSKIEALMRELSDLNLPTWEDDDLCWLNRGCNSSLEIENQKIRLENCIIEYLTKTSGMMGVALAKKEANLVIQKFTRLELFNSTYFMIPNWVLIFRRIFSWRLMNLNSGEASSTYVLAKRSEPEAITFYPPYNVDPWLDELVEVGHQTNGGGFVSNYIECETLERLSHTTRGDSVVLVENEKKSSEDESCEHSEIEKNNDGGRSVRAAKDNEEADKLSKLLEKCNILQNMIDEKLSIYF